MRTTWLLPALAALMQLGVLQGCNDGFEPSRLEKPAILALRATQDPEAESGRKYLLEALTHEVDTLTWTVCPAPWIPTEEGVICPVPDFAQTLPASDDTKSAEFDLTGIPIDDGTPIYIRADADDESVVPAVMSVVLGATPRNPDIDGFSINGQPLSDWSPATDSIIEVALKWKDASDAEGATTAFFTTAGKFKPWRVVGNGSTELDFHGAPGSVKVYAITRYLGEGTSWASFEVVP